ncbi:MAG: UDP-N-acetylmuramoyl-L-alanine--D-glutamate ligase [Alphaproteobacteria bacterium]|nr:UDP-N-acetylmuramoyl-L-alanine--D-glutamate ligase [Alphaproteobacteria bacterium]MDX5368242.1 UDP-N-acetylmuramoyl-L-alanine--D-glutamate ligase [Alphaproteobacteria bacterium]MDX5463051.1 UDP-N-acetylmuramoyl-L-alanine--D-glutamate ligase [Alphaproteobacteria bacterium]
MLARGFQGRNVVVFGLSRTGLAVARALALGGARVSAWDDQLAAREKAAALGIPLDDPSRMAWGEVSALVLSPGVPLTHPQPHWVVDLAHAAGTPVIGDIEVLARTLTLGTAPRHVIGVTGTNGKSTTTALIGHLLGGAFGLDHVAVAGNIGRAVFDLEHLPDEALVLELSSYQLDLVKSFRPTIGAWLNITPDHIDRHGDIDGYVRAKKRMFAAMTAKDVAVVGVDDTISAGVATELEKRKDGPRVVRVSVGSRTRKGVSCVDGLIHENGRPAADVRDVPSLRGAHNWQNAAVAFAVARAAGVSATDIAARIGSFPGLAHRMEEIAVVGGVRFVNDSKATNADAAAKSLGAFERIYWIAGGRAKEGGIAPLAPLFPRIARAYLIGEAAPQFAQTLGRDVPHTLAGTLERAVARAYADARADGSGDATVLLAPACASFDQFSDYEARGAAFRALALGIAHEKNGEAA